MKTILALIIATTLSTHQFDSDGANRAHVNGIFSIVIDPGHGGKDEGMSFNGAIEKNITLAIASYLVENDLSRTSVMLLRADDTHIPLSKRIKAARSCDLYISLHTSFHESLKSGPSVFYSSKGARAASSKGYADFFATHLTHGEEEGRQSETESFVLDNLECPGIVINAGNLGTISDFYHLTGKEGQQQLAKEIADIIQLLADAKSKHAFAMRAKSHRPMIDSLFFENLGKVGQNN